MLTFFFKYSLTWLKKKVLVLSTPSSFIQHERWKLVTDTVTVTPHTHLAAAQSESKQEAKCASSRLEHRLPLYTLVSLQEASCLLASCRRHCARGGKSHFQFEFFYLHSHLKSMDRKACAPTSGQHIFSSFLPSFFYLLLSPNFIFNSLEMKGKNTHRHTHNMNSPQDVPLNVYIIYLWEKKDKYMCLKHVSKYIYIFTKKPALESNCCVGGNEKVFTAEEASEREAGG